MGSLRGRRGTVRGKSVCSAHLPPRTRGPVVLHSLPALLRVVVLRAGAFVCVTPRPPSPWPLPPPPRRGVVWGVGAATRMDTGSTGRGGRPAWLTSSSARKAERRGMGRSCSRTHRSTAAAAAARRRARAARTAAFAEEHPRARPPSAATAPRAAAPLRSCPHRSRGGDVGRLRGTGGALVRRRRDDVVRLTRHPRHAQHARGASPGLTLRGLPSDLSRAAVSAPMRCVGARAGHRGHSHPPGETLGGVLRVPSSLGGCRACSALSRTHAKTHSS